MNITDMELKNDRELVRSVWPDWELLEEINSGQFGTVYKARKSGFAGESYAAVKVVRIEPEADDSGFTTEQTDSYLAGIARDYAREIRMLEQVKGYSNIVSIEDYEICQNSGGNPWYVLIRMELLHTLHEDLSGKEISDELVIRIGRDICQALEVCASRQIVHRDIKPGNVLVNDDGVYKLGDFGVARQITRYTSNTITGTPDYMAPEVFRKALKAADFAQAHNADVYSLGMLLYWVANGMVLPFLKPNGLYTPEVKQDAFNRKMSGEKIPPPGKVSPALQRVILKACAYDPSDRYKTASEFREALENINAAPISPGKKKHNGLLITAAVVCFVLLAGFLLETLRVIDFIPGYPTPAETSVLPPTPTPTLTPTSTPICSLPSPTPSPSPTPTPVCSTNSPTPSPTPTPTPTPTSTSTTVPVPPLSEIYKEKEVQLRAIGKSSEKVRLFSGPGDEYSLLRLVNPGEKHEAEVFYIENGWAFTHFKHKLQALVEAYAYISERAFAVGQLDDVPEISDLPYVMKTVRSDTVPRQGPGRQYEKWEELTVPRDASVKCYFEKNGYCFVEWQSVENPVRFWILSESLADPGE